MPARGWSRLPLRHLGQTQLAWASWRCCWGRLPAKKAKLEPQIPYEGAMKITAIETHILCIPSVNTGATSSAQDEIVVIVHTDVGLSGIGETDASPWMVKAAIEAPGTHTMGLGLKEMLLGEDPRETDKLWNKMYSGSKMNGRRGLVINAMGALDMALWDIKGKAAGKPVWELLSKTGKAAKEFITPYASLQPDASSFEAYKASLVAWAVKAKSLGFKAAKLECTLSGPYAHSGLNEPDGAKVTEVVRACREAVGSDFTLMVDAQYTWETCEAALAVLREWDDLDIFFIETPINMDNVKGIRALTEQCKVPVAYGEWQCTHFEFEDLIERANIQVAQPDVGRVGGLTEAVKVCDLAAKHGKIIVPHCWKTGIGIAATAHLAAITPHCPFIEFLPAELTDSVLRQELTHNELQLNEDGLLPIPRKPGLGVELNYEVLQKYRVNGCQIVPPDCITIGDVLAAAK